MYQRSLRVDDANEDLNLSMSELNEIAGHDAPSSALIAKAVVRVLGSIAVTLAAMLDHMRKED